MQVGKILISSLIFVFTMFLMQPLEDGIAAMTYSGPLVILLEAFPILFVAVSAVFPIFFLLQGDKE